MQNRSKRDLCAIPPKSMPGYAQDVADAENANIEGGKMEAGHGDTWLRLRSKARKNGERRL